MNSASVDYAKLNEEKESKKKLFAPMNSFESNIEFESSDKNEINIDNKLNKNTIHLLTYNFFFHPPPVNTNKDDYKDSRLNDFVELLPKFDIICFQELFTTLNDSKHKMIREGAKVGLKYYLSSKVPSFFSKSTVDGGLLILSRYEIVEHDSYDYYINILGDSICSKGILYAKIKINDKYLFLFNTHLQASYLDDSQTKINNSIQVRTSQTEELINYVYNKILNSPREEINSGCVLIAGDFNIDAHDNKFAKDKYIIPKYNCSEYIIFKQKINKLGHAIDLMEKKYNGHEYTFGNNEKEEYDQVLTSKAEINLKQTLDYIWEIIPDFNLDIYKQGIINFNKNYSYDDNNNKDKKITVLYDTFQVQKFLVKNRPYQQLSDHFGVSVELYSPYNKSLNNSINEDMALPLKES
jgi:endonuclease/exonuclease/phosphatase family metal-dependent hydrolase